MSKDIFDEIDNEQLKNDFYFLAMMDYEYGATIEQLEEILESYQEAEMYMQCVGIKKAIDEIKSL